MLDKGLRFGGGIGDITEPIHYNDATEHYAVKLAHDATFHIIVKVILLNVLFGIIIDTFAQLRDEKARIDNDKVNVCFICNHPRMLFDKVEGGMERHIAHDHNLWNYVYYMVHLNSKDTSDHNGIESYINSKYNDKDVSWLPRGKALCLQSIIDDDEDDRAADELRTTMRNWQQSIHAINKELDALVVSIEKNEELEAKRQEEAANPDAK